MFKDLDIKRFISLGILIAFFINCVGSMQARADEYLLPKPGVMVRLSPPLDPPILKGFKVYPDNPFRFDFILDKGDSELSNDQLKDESSKLIKYFLASLTISEKDLWVNLSPYEKNRIIPQSFGLTEMGRDLLAEDYMLKQITASLIYPEDEIGKKFWKRVYELAKEKYGTSNMPVNTFNKVWIVPEKAVVYENAKAGAAYVVESKLKVMLEQDYLSLEKHAGAQSNQTQTKDTSQLGSQIVREIVIPELTKEVNENKNFAKLRQVYNSLILATWYKKKIKDSILSKVYSDKNKVAGVDIDDPKEKERIYQRYLQAFKKGVYNYIKEDIDPMTQETVPRKYFSGGMDFAMNATSLGISRAMVVNSNKSFTGNFSLLNKISRGGLLIIGASLLSLVPKAVAQQNRLMTTQNNVEITASNSTNGSEAKLRELEGSLNDKTVLSEEKLNIVRQILMLIEDQPGLLKVSRQGYLESLLKSSSKAVDELAGDYLVDEYVKLFEKGQLPLRTIEGMLDQDWLHQRIAAMVLSEKIYPQMIKTNQMKLLDLKPMIKRGGIFSAVAARAFANSLDGNQDNEAFNRREVSAVVESLVSVLKTRYVAEHSPIVQAEGEPLFGATPKATVPSSPTQEALKALLKLSQIFNGTLTFGVMTENTSEWSNMGEVFKWLDQNGYFESNLDGQFNALAHPVAIVDEEGLKIKLAEKFPDILKKPDYFKNLLHLLKQTYEPWGRSVLPAVRRFIDKNGYNADAYSVLFQIAHNHPAFFQPSRISYFEQMSQDLKLQGDQLVDILGALYEDNEYLVYGSELRAQMDQLRQKSLGSNIVIQRAVAKVIVDSSESGLQNNRYALEVPGLNGDTYAQAVKNIFRLDGMNGLVGSLDIKDLTDYAYETLIFRIIYEVLENKRPINPTIASALSRAVQKEGMKPEVYAKLAEVIKKRPDYFEPGLAQVMTNAFIPDYLFDHGFACWPVYLNKYLQEQFSWREGDDHQDILRYEVASSVYRLIIGSGNEITDKNIEDGIKLIVTLRERMNDLKPFSSEHTLVNILHAQERFEASRLERLELNSGADKNKVSSFKGVANNRKALEKIANSKGPLTIFTSGHGGRTQLWQEFGLRPGDDVNTDMNNPNAISYKLLGDALIKREKLDQVIILLDDCYSSDFRDNLIKYLRRKFLEKHTHDSYPIVVAWADINSNSYGDRFLLDLEKSKQVSLSDLLNPSRNTLGLEKPTVVVSVPDDLIKKFPQFTPVSLQLHGPTVHVPYQTAPPMIQISYNGIIPVLYYTGNWLFDSAQLSKGDRAMISQFKDEIISKIREKKITEDKLHRNLFRGTIFGKTFKYYDFFFSTRLLNEFNKETDVLLDENGNEIKGSQLSEFIGVEMDDYNLHIFRLIDEGQIWHSVYVLVPSNGQTGKVGFLANDPRLIDKINEFVISGHITQDGFSNSLIQETEGSITRYLEDNFKMMHYRRYTWPVSSVHEIFRDHPTTFNPYQTFYWVVIGDKLVRIKGFGDLEHQGNFSVINMEFDDSKLYLITPVIDLTGKEDPGFTFHSAKERLEDYARKRGFGHLIEAMSGAISMASLRLMLGVFDLHAAQEYLDKEIERLTEVPREHPWPKSEGKIPISERDLWQEAKEMDSIQSIIRQELAYFKRGTPQGAEFRVEEVFYDLYLEIEGKPGDYVIYGTQLRKSDLTLNNDLQIDDLQSGHFIEIIRERALGTMPKARDMVLRNIEANPQRSLGLLTNYQHIYEGITGYLYLRLDEWQQENQNKNMKFLAERLIRHIKDTENDDDKDDRIASRIYGFIKGGSGAHDPVHTPQEVERLINYVASYDQKENDRIKDLLTSHQQLLFELQDILGDTPEVKQLYDNCVWLKAQRPSWTTDEIDGLDPRFMKEKFGATAQYSNGAARTWDIRGRLQTVLINHLTDAAIKSDRAMFTIIKKANGPGGIDLTPAHMHLQTQNAGSEIKFNLDPALMAQLQNAPGFVPLIINIQPMDNLKEFLGMSN